MNESHHPIKPDTCPACGATLAGGLCPRCLMADAAQATQAQGTAPAGALPSQAEVAAAFPQLEIIELIGAGGMGNVWRARQPTLDRFVALKLLPAMITQRDPSFAERFAREGQLLARLHHPNIVTVHDSGRAGDFFYLIMELVDGVNLRQAMRASRFTPQQALAIVPKICDALQYAHEEGVLHRDIKPENILLDARGRVKLVDFGIAKLMTQTEGAPAGESAPALASSLTQGGTALGTPQYMAPEQMERPADVDQRADIYSLGVVFYELLTGELPHGRFVPPSEKSEADPRVDGIVRQALERERERRQGSVGELRTQVETIAATPPPQSVSSPAAPAGQAWQSPTMGWGHFIGYLFGITFTSPLAYKLANLSALGFLCFLGFMPLPGWQGCFGFSGFFGLIGAAFIVETFARGKRGDPSARQFIMVGRCGGKAVVNWPGVLLGFVIALAVAETFVAVASLVVINRIAALPLFALFCSVLAAVAAIVIRKKLAAPLDKLVPLDEPVVAAPTSRFSRTAVFGFVIWLLPLVMLAVAYLTRRMATHPVMPDGTLLANKPALLVSASLLVAAGLLALGAMILGWIAVAQIRRSAGRLHGMWLAVFDGLLFPLLVLDCGFLFGFRKSVQHIFVEFYANSSALNDPHVHPPFLTRLANALQLHDDIYIFVCIATSIVVNLLIIQAVWRAVNRPPGAEPMPAHSSSWRTTGIGLLTLAGILTATVLALLFAPLPVSPPQAASAFGPDRECVLPEPVVGAACLLDFETGQFITPPKDLAGKLELGLPDIGEEAVNWLRESGADAVVNMPNHGSLRLFEGVALSLARNQGAPLRWEQFTPGDVVAALGQAGWERGKRFVKSGHPFYATPATAPIALAFITREGSPGVLEIQGMSASPRGLKIRYKLLKRERSGSTLVSKAALDVFDALASAEQTLGSYLQRKDAPGALAWLDHTIKPEQEQLVKLVAGTSLEQRTRVLILRFASLRAAIERKDWDATVALFSGNPDKTYADDLRRLVLGTVGPPPSSAHDDSLSLEQAMNDFNKRHHNAAVPSPAASNAAIGIALANKEGRMVIASIVPHTPASDDGRLKPGDEVVKFGDSEDSMVSVAGLTVGKCALAMRGKDGSKITLLVVPTGKTEAAAYKLTLTRRLVPVLEAERLGQLGPPSQATRAPSAEKQTPPATSKSSAVTAPVSAPDDSLSLEQAVNDFNKRYHNEAVAAGQPPLTVESVLAAIRWAMLDRPQLSVTNETFAALGRVIETKVLPKNFELELLTGYEPDDKATFDMWSVRLRIPGTVIPGGTTCIMIHEQQLGSHVIGEEERKVIHAWQDKQRAQGGVELGEGMLKYRQEREAAAAIDAQRRPAPPVVPAASVSDWHQRFLAAYRLEEGEVVKYIPPPFVPERVQYYRNQDSLRIPAEAIIGQGGTVAEPPSWLVFHQGGQELRQQGFGYMGWGEHTLQDVLHDVFRLNSYQFEGQDDLMRMKVAGDWTLREATDTRTLLAAFEAALRRETKRSIHLEKRRVEREVIVATGALKSGIGPGKVISVYAETTGGPQGVGGGGELPAFLAEAGDRLGVRIVNETSSTAGRMLEWAMCSDSSHIRMGARREQMTSAILSHVTDQTGLVFKREKRPVDIWFVTAQQ